MDLLVYKRVHLGVCYTEIQHVDILLFELSGLEHNLNFKTNAGKQEKTTPLPYSWVHTLHYSLTRGPWH